MIHEWVQESWEDRVKAFLETKDSPSRFNWPFPMGVFGTLRKSQCNSSLMNRAKIEDHRLAFLPHFSAESLRVKYEKNATAPFEVFFYSPEEWNKMINRVDGLESFDPQSDHGGDNNGYYFRTLVWLHLLPTDYEDEWFPKNRQVSLWGYRNMKFDPSEWNNYPKVPCWVYSNMRSTKLAKQEENSPIIWPY